MAMTRTESIDETLLVDTDANTAYRALAAAFHSVGKPKTEDPQFRRIVGKIYSGAGKMNAATVTVSVDAVGADGSRIKINASAQEGLIKQHTAPRAVSRLLDALTQQGLSSMPSVSASPTSATSSRRDADTSVADELTKMVVLRDAGVLTDAEFATQKAKLLGG
jgi:hypothetical protein